MEINKNYAKSEKHPMWKGGRVSSGHGYMLIHNPAYPRADKRNYVYEHILVMEASLGRAILITEIVHHIDGDGTNNKIGNLMLFETKAMHNSFHKRLKAFQKTGHWDWEKCQFCQEYDSPDNLYTRERRTAHHRVCHNIYQNNRRGSQ